MQQILSILLLFVNPVEKHSGCRLQTFPIKVNCIVCIQRRHNDERRMVGDSCCLVFAFLDFLIYPPPPLFACGFFGKCLALFGGGCCDTTSFWTAGGCRNINWLIAWSSLCVLGSGSFAKVESPPEAKRRNTLAFCGHWCYCLLRRKTLLWRDRNARRNS